MFRGWKFACLLVAAGMFLLSVAGDAKVLFKEDFEGGIDANVWVAPKEWKTGDSKGVAGLGKNVLELNGGETGITKKNDFSDFVFEADFKAGSAGKITGFVFRAQNNNNDFYMHQISTDGSAHTPNNIRWHWKVKGAWNVAAIPFEGGQKVPPETWYRARWILKGGDFEVSAIPKADYGKKEMIRLAKWTDDKNAGKAFYLSGAVGFRSSGGEAMQFDNIVAADSLADIITAVEPKDKIAVTWGDLKAR